MILILILKALGIVGDFAVVDASAAAAKGATAAVFDSVGPGDGRTSGWRSRPASNGPAQPTPQPAVEPNGDPGVGPGHLRRPAGTRLSPDPSLPGPPQHDPVRLRRSPKGNNNQH